MSRAAILGLHVIRIRVDLQLRIEPVFHLIICFFLPGRLIDPLVKRRYYSLCAYVREPGPSLRSAVNTSPDRTGACSYPSHTFELDRPASAHPRKDAALRMRNYASRRCPRAI